MNALAITPQRGRFAAAGNAWARLRSALERDVVRRVLVALMLVLGAYHYSLTTLMRALTVDSPLAYLGLIPLISLAMIVRTAVPESGDIDVHDRALDRIIGIPLIVVPLLIMVVLPAQLSTYFWVWRIDLLSMPFFVAGVIALTFGTRMLIRSRLGLLWLFAAWPVPFQFIVQRGMEPFTKLTVVVLERLVSFLPIAYRAPALEGGFVIDGPRGGFMVVVASACSGANSLVGFLLVGGALAALGTGTRLAKTLWLTVGGTLVWLLNVIRIGVIFAIGTKFGERAAIDVFHPYIGLVFFSIAVTVMVLCAGRFGLTLGGTRRSMDALERSVVRGAPAWRTSALLLGAVAIVMALLNANLSSVDPVAGALGTPKIASFERTALELDGYAGEKSDTFAWTERFFGDGSNWSRYRYTGDGNGELTSTFPVLADVVTTSNVQSFNDFGVEACYRFHGYSVDDERRVDLGNGVTGRVLAWQDPDRPITWTSVYWHWPVATPKGRRYQRVVLMYNTSDPSTVTSPTPSKSLASSLGFELDALLNPTGDDSTVLPADAHAADVEVFLVSFAQRLISTSVTASDGLVDDEGVLK